MTDLKAFTEAYIEAIYFTETGEGDQPAADSNLSSYSRVKAEQTCSRFWAAYGERITEAGADPSQAGHDLWLTRQGHGAGFWDRDDDVYGTDGLREELTRAAKAIGEVDEIVFAHEEGESIWDQVQRLLHYPACWDTAAYPSVTDALEEVLSTSFTCATCPIDLGKVGPA